MNKIIWKCEGCGEDACITVTRIGDGRPTECIFGAVTNFEGSRKWEVGSFKDLDIENIKEE